MYKIIGGDGRQYGPVTAEQVREWIAAGRANAQTQIQREGETDWKPLSDFSEFVDALAAKPPAQLPPPTPVPPSSSAPDPTALANEVLARGCEVNIGSCLGRAWDLLAADFWPVIGVSALMLVILGTVGILAGPLVGGLFWYFLKKIRREPAQVSDAFAGFNQSFVPLFVGALVAGLLVSIDLAACVLPGIYLAVAWKLTLPIIIDKRIGFWDAMEVSRKVATSCWWSLFLFLIVCALINFVGVLACGVGIFFTWPLTVLALTFLYEDFFGSAKPAAV
jgi:hypothetical protein